MCMCGRAGWETWESAGLRPTSRFSVSGVLTKVTLVHFWHEVYGQKLLHLKLCLILRDGLLAGLAPKQTFDAFVQVVFFGQPVPNNKLKTAELKEETYLERESRFFFSYRFQNHYSHFDIVLTGIMDAELQKWTLEKYKLSLMTERTRKNVLLICAH